MKLHTTTAAKVLVEVNYKMTCDLKNKKNSKEFVIKIEHLNIFILYNVTFRLIMKCLSIIMTCMSDFLVYSGYNFSIN